MARTTLTDIADENASVKEILLDRGRLHTEARDALADTGLITSEASVRRYRAANGWTALPVEDEPEPDQKVGAKETVDALTIYHDSWPFEISDDWGPLLDFFGFKDHSKFAVIEDSVAINKWQQSKGHKDGTRDVIWLYAVKARFAKVKAEIDVNGDLDEVLARLAEQWVPIQRTLGIPTDEVWYVHQQGDEQNGKGAGGGILGLEERSSVVLEKSVARLKDLMRTTPGLAGIVDVSNGDAVENIFGHYNSQQRTTETLRKQMRSGRGLDIRRTTALSQFGLPIKKVYCTDNHGEMRQAVGAAPFTSESDNLALMLAESVQDVLSESVIADMLEWFIPHDEWWTLVPDVAGINLAVGHGHKAKGAIDNWVKNQRDDMNHWQGYKVHMALLGHKHHFMALDVSGTTLIQTPSLDGGSDYFAAMAGKRSKHGALSYIIGSHFNQYFSNLEVI